MGMGPRQAELMGAMMLDQYERNGSYRQNQRVYLETLRQISAGIRQVFDLINADVEANMAWASEAEVILLQTLQEVTRQVTSHLLLAIAMETDTPFPQEGPQPGTVTYEQPSPRHVNFG